jgi:hypothetical protein
MTSDLPGDGRAEDAPVTEKIIAPHRRVRGAAEPGRCNECGGGPNVRHAGETGPPRRPLRISRDLLGQWLQ